MGYHEAAYIMYGVRVNPIVMDEIWDSKDPEEFEKYLTSIGCEIQAVGISDEPRFYIIGIMVAGEYNGCCILDVIDRNYFTDKFKTFQIELITKLSELVGESEYDAEPDLYLFGSYG